ncbi:XapX domain-containing protein [Salipaludibacillus keqinensis]|jgi:XapX domain-containing protein|uniref:XapX domain-containing protein n=1 Tax=Salipaludibacillus keqinensis TaxID=2045207 RepID=A0A323T4Q2_9BACI|nr:XapX domain-containing protein [Salipaludibacillus keqinensis]PYZ91588.1 XapX domain-containing protein [Salipaludibacillus keqinensis]
MQEVILALLAGLIVGFVFAAIKLPIPAPPALPGIMGIFGIYFGFKLFQWVSTTFFG